MTETIARTASKSMLRGACVRRPRERAHSLACRRPARPASPPARQPTDTGPGIEIRDLPHRPKPLRLTFIPVPPPVNEPHSTDPYTRPMILNIIKFHTPLCNIISRIKMRQGIKMICASAEFQLIVCSNNSTKVFIIL